MDKQKVSTLGSAALLIGASILLFLAQSAYWVNHTIFNQENFTRITTAALTEESSRDAIATAVVDKALADKPIVQRVAGERAKSLISGLLGSDLSLQAIDALGNKAYAYTTSPDRQDVKIDLAPIKTPLATIITLVQDDERQAKLENIDQKIPDEVVLIESDSFPDLSGAVQAMLWLGPLFWLGAFSLFGTYIYIGRAMYAKRIYLVGLAIIIVAIIGQLASPVVPPPVAAAVPNISLRPVAENIAVGLLEPFRIQMLHMFGYTLFALLIFNQRFTILSAVKSLEQKLPNQTKKKSRK